MAIDVRFWGTRGSFPAMGPEFARYGGDTSCVSAICAERTFVFDAGTGFARLGRTIPGPADIDLFLSHTHLDHIMGLLYFDPIWRAGTTIRIWLEERAAPTIREALNRQFGPPFHPVPLAEVPASIEWLTYQAGKRFAPRHDVQIIAMELPHPGGAFGFRLEHGGAALVYGADTGELVGAQRDAALMWARGADLLILDATFTCAQAEKYPDWGHMSWRQAAEFGADAGAASIALFHHGPDRTDDELDQTAREAAEISPRTIMARDGLALKL